ncbi:MAG: hypothetical protein M0Z84_06875 [Gammaproteobacteria bacterium]|nr:hypothetical protein [Gammaproteobacteria bacterium]
MRGDDGFDELTLGCVLELEVQAFDGGAVCGQLLSQLQVEDRIPGKALQVIENHYVPIVRLRFQKSEHGDHAGALHEVPAAGHIVVEDGFDLVAVGSRICPAAMLLAMQPVSVVFLFLVGNPAVDDGPSRSRVRHDPASSE